MYLIHLFLTIGYPEMSTTFLHYPERDKIYKWQTTNRKEANGTAYPLYRRSARLALLSLAQVKLPLPPHTSTNYPPP